MKIGKSKKGKEKDSLTYKKGLKRRSPWIQYLEYLKPNSNCILWTKPAPDVDNLGPGYLKSNYA